MRKRAEESFAAGIAPIRRKGKESPNPTRQALSHAITLDPAQIKVTAARAMSVSGEGKGHPASMESKTASVAPPRPESNPPE